MVPNIKKGHFTIGNCKNLTVKFMSKTSVKRVIRTNGIIKIPTNSNSNIFFKMRNKNFPAKRDFIFIPKKINKLKINGGVLSHIIYIHIISVQVINDSTKNVYLYKNNKLNIIQNYLKKCYFTNAENVFLNK